MAHVRKPTVISVGTAAKKLESANSADVIGVRRRSILIRNLSGASVFLGNAEVTADVADGWELAAGADFQDTVTNGDIYAVVASGTADVQIWEVHE